ncbi:MAG: MFS transporter [Chlamydiales bacterium]
MIKNNIDDHFLRQTRMAYTWTRILNTPFWALYILLPFIILKDLQATPWQIACIISSRPIVSLFSLYWSGLIKRRRDRLRSNIIWASILGHLPFLFVPFINDPWFFVFASAIYMLFWRGVNPAWMEILKINVPEEARHNVFAYGSAFYHAGGAVLAIVMGWLMDDYFQAWRWLFPLTTLLSFFAVLFQIKLPFKEAVYEPDLTQPSFFSIVEQFKKPWIEAWHLLRQRADFAHFQIGFMLAGGGLMLWKPAEPLFFIETLHLNYKELSIAITLCKSIGYTLALPLWTRAMKRIDIFTFCSAVTALTALFPLGLIAAQMNLLFLYAAYLLYGMMQAGSEMSWNLSGPIFSKHEESSTYSGVNVLTVGLRGCVAPPFGSLLCQLTNATVVLLVGGGFSLLATWQMYRYRSPKEKQNLVKNF